APASTRCARPAGYPPVTGRACGTESRRRSAPGSRLRAPRSTTSATSTAPAAPSRTGSSSTGAPASRVSPAAARSGRSSWGDAGPTCASTASRVRGLAALRRQQLAELPRAVRGEELGEATERVIADQDLREGVHPRLLLELGATVRVPCQIDLL